MTTATILADNGVLSGVAGIKPTGGNDGTLQLQTTTAGGVATTAQTIGTDQVTTFAQAANLPNTFGFKNRLINGSFLINQRNGTNAVTTSALQASTYFSDRWYYYVDQASKMSLTQSTDAPAGFTSSNLVTVLATDSTGPEQMVRQKIEGYNIADLGWGAAGAKPIVLSFWVKSSLTGQFGGSLQTDSGSVWSYPFSYTISAANTWEQKTVYVTGPTSGTFPTTNSGGVVVSFEFGPGYQAASPNAWLNSNSTTATGSQNLCATLGATLRLTGVQLEKGTAATSFDFRSIGTELALCQRYYAKLGLVTDSALGSGITQNSSSGVVYVKFPCTMRAAPTIGQSTLWITDCISYNAVVSGISSSNVSTDAARIFFSTNAVQTTYRPAILTCGGGSAYLELSSEL